MQKSIPSKALSLLLTLLLFLGVFATVQIASPVVWAKTVGNYEIDFATSGTTATFNGITATATIGNKVYNGRAYDWNADEYKRGDCVDVTVDFSGTATDAGRLMVFLDGIGDSGSLSTGDNFFVDAGTGLSNENITIPFCVEATGNNTFLELRLDLEDHNGGVYKLTMPAPKSVNGVTVSVKSSYYGSYIGAGVEVDPLVEIEGTANLAGTYTIILSNNQILSKDRTKYQARSSSSEFYNIIPSGKINADDYWWYMGGNWGEISKNIFLMPDHDLNNFQFEVIFTPSGSYGGSSSSSKSKSSGSGGGSSGGTQSTRTTSSNVSSNGSISSTAIQSQANAALKGSGNNAILQTKNAESISASTLKNLANTANKAGKDLVIHADTTDANGNVQGRLYVEPAKLSGLTGDLKLGVYTDPVKTEVTRSFFTKWFSNTVAVVSCEQQGSFGANLRMAVNVDLSKLNTKSLVFYSYDSKTNTYTQIKNTDYSIDKNGYLHFTSDKGNNIVITDKPLQSQKIIYK